MMSKKPKEQTSIQTQMKILLSFRAIPTQLGTRVANATASTYAAPASSVTPLVNAAWLVETTIGFRKSPSSQTPLTTSQMNVRIAKLLTLWSSCTLRTVLLTLQPSQTATSLPHVVIRWSYS